MALLITNKNTASFVGSRAVVGLARTPSPALSAAARALLFRGHPGHGRVLVLAAAAPRGLFASLASRLVAHILRLSCERVGGHGIFTSGDKSRLLGCLRVGGEISERVEASGGIAGVIGICMSSYNHAHAHG